MLLYRIEFEVDNGTSYIRDVALVKAYSLEEANNKLKQMINSIDSETCVYKIYKTSIFYGEVFTAQHGWK